MNQSQYSLFSVLSLWSRPLLTIFYNDHEHIFLRGKINVLFPPTRTRIYETTLSIMQNVNGDF